jgi:hypothetical protein
MVNVSAMSRENTLEEQKELESQWLVYVLDSSQE